LIPGIGFLRIVAGELPCLVYKKSFSILPNQIGYNGVGLTTIDQKYGPRIFKSAIDKMHPTYYARYRYPLYTLEEFKTVLADLTNDTAILDLFSEYGF